MALIDELKARREAAANKLEDAYLSAAHLRADVDDLDLAIAALEPLPVAEMESTGANQPDDYGLQPSAHLTHDSGVFGPFTADGHENDVCVPVPGAGEESRDHSDDASKFAESETKAAIERLVDDMVGGLELSPDAVGTQTYMDGDQLVIREITADEYFAPAPENVTPEPGGYGPVTSPEADFSAKALDHYDPKAVADRERFNPFNIFKREGDQ